MFVFPRSSQWTCSWLYIWVQNVVINLHCFTLHSRYLQQDHLRHCVPSSVSSGLANLPLKYVYTDGVANHSRPTDPTLPLTDQVLNGKKSYGMIMPYFTTNNMTPIEVNKLGYEMLDKLYPKVNNSTLSVFLMGSQCYEVKGMVATLIIIAKPRHNVLSKAWRLWCHPTQRISFHINKFLYFNCSIIFFKAVEVAREVTKIYNDNDTAVVEFRKILNSSDSYFNKKPFPQNESNEEAHKRCSDVKGAKKYCPTRWLTIQKWFDEARKVRIKSFI